MVIQEFATSTASNVLPMAALSGNGPVASVQSSVAEFYNGKTVFITGGTGFMGKVTRFKFELHFVNNEI